MFIQQGWRWIKQTNNCFIFVNRATVWLQSDDHARHSPNLIRCPQGWALKRRQAVIFGQANGLFLTSAEHNSAICCRESLSAPCSSLWNREWTNGNLRAALSSWVQDSLHMDSLLFSLVSCPPPAPHSHSPLRFPFSVAQTFLVLS